MKITFIGLGLMGSRMVKHLLDAGHSVLVYNRSEEPKLAAKKIGATVANSIEEAVKGAEIIVSMLSKPKVVKDVMLMNALPHIKKQALWIDCSTVDPAFAKEASAECAKAQVRYLEAPVAGSTPQVEAKQLVIFAGGTATDLEEAKPILETFSKKIVHSGAVGMGASMKLVVNMMLGTSMMAFAEALRFGESLGLDNNFLLKTLPSLPVAAPFTQAKAALIESENYEPQFPLELIHKDLHLAAMAAYEAQVSLPFSNAAKELYAQAVEKGYARKDLSAIYESLRTSDNKG